MPSDAAAHWSSGLKALPLYPRTASRASTEGLYMVYTDRTLFKPINAGRVISFVGSVFLG